MWISQRTDFSVFELDEVYWYIKRKTGHETRANTYIMTMMSRTPRQIVAFAVDNGVKAERIQEMADRVGYAKEYCTDGCAVYREVIFGGKHKQNSENKSDTHNIESSNADLRHYIAGLRRKSRCFFRSQETLEAVLSVFIDAYNKFGEAKEKYKIPVEHRTTNTKHLHKYRERPFSVLDFL